MENIGVLDAGIIALLGYAVVFFGIILLMIVVMIMAIGANQMGKPLNELRFISIKEVKD